jgi:trans-2,3-dihydro-3-hydroxyanthranilate isomerase
MNYNIELSYTLLDVFTNRPFLGNQLAVFVEANVDRTTMQAIARELNLSETVFVNRAPGAVASLQIFTPFHEMRFAGHPTIGAALVLADDAGWVDPSALEFELQLGVGPIRIVLERGSTATVAWLTTPPVRFGTAFGTAEAAAMIGLSAQDVRADLPAGLAGADVPFLYLPVVSGAEVDRAAVVAREVRARAGWDDINGIYVYALTGEGAYSRMFAPMSGIAEDPATGSAAGPLAAMLDRNGALPAGDRFTIRQGVAMGRESELFVRRARWSDGSPAFQVGGSAVRAGRGTLFV